MDAKTLTEWYGSPPKKNELVELAGYVAELAGLVNYAMRLGGLLEDAERAGEIASAVAKIEAQWKKVA